MSQEHDDAADVTSRNEAKELAKGGFIPPEKMPLIGFETGIEYIISSKQLTEILCKENRHRPILFGADPFQFQHVCAIDGIRLVREGGENETQEYAVVYIQRNGVWYEAIRELLSSHFDHLLTYHGLASDQLKRASWEESNEGAEEQEP